MAIERWDPFREAISLRDAMNTLLQESFVRPTGMASDAGRTSMPIDVRETENEFIVETSLPGFKPEDVQITVHGDTVTIRGEHKGTDEKQGENWLIRERRFGSFQRSFLLDTPVDANKAKAHFENGELRLVLPKSEQAKPRMIKIGNGSSGTQAQEKQAQEKTKSSTKSTQA